MNNNFDFSLILASYKRPELLRIGLSSILRNKPNYNFEIVVVNDGIIDDTEKVCNEFIQKGLNIKYIFSGQRNLDGKMKSRVAGFALNIGVKNCSSDIVVLSCPEIYHLTNVLNNIITSLRKNPRSMVIQEYIYFDQTQVVTNQLLKCSDEELKTIVIDTSLLNGGENDGMNGHGIMPYCMGFYKHEFMSIGGYDERFTGYAADDNDLVDRMIANGMKHVRVPGKIIHLWHGGTGDGLCHFENPNWVFNYNLLQSSKGQINRNVGKSWGVI